MDIIEDLLVEQIDLLSQILRIQIRGAGLAERLEGRLKIDAQNVIVVGDHLAVGHVDDGGGSRSSPIVRFRGLVRIIKTFIAELLSHTAFGLGELPTMLITTVDNLRSEHIPQSQQTNHDALATVPTAAGGSQYMVTPGFRRSLARLGSETNRELVTLATERAVRRLLDGRLLHRTVTPLRILRLLAVGAHATGVCRPVKMQCRGCAAVVQSECHCCSSFKIRYIAVMRPSVRFRYGSYQASGLSTTGLES